MKIRFIAMIAATLLATGCQTSLITSAPEDLEYLCGAIPLTVTLDNTQEQVEIFLDGKPRFLKQAVSASGAKYKGDGYIFWSKGESATLFKGDEILLGECLLQK